jgi:hypothetical protein
VILNNIYAILQIEVPMSIRRLPAFQNKLNRRQRRWTMKDMLQDEIDTEEAMEFLEEKEYENTKNHAPWSIIDQERLEKEMYRNAVEAQQEHYNPENTRRVKSSPRKAKKESAQRSRLIELDRLHEELELKEAKLQKLIEAISTTAEWTAISGMGMECEKLGFEIDDLRKQIQVHSNNELVRLYIREQEKKLEHEMRHHNTKRLRKQYSDLKSEEKKLYRERKTKQPKVKRIAYQFETTNPTRTQTPREKKKLIKRSWQKYRDTRAPTPISEEERHKKMSRRVPITRVRGGLDTREKGQRQTKLKADRRRNTRKKFK